LAFAGMNITAVVVAAVVSFLFGALWYGMLGSVWRTALGKTADELRAATGGSPLPFVISFLSLLLMAWVLAGTIGHLGPGHVTVRAGLISAGFIFAGFVATTVMTNHRFEGARWSLTLIDGGHWLGVLLIQGAIIGWMGV
jgi:Protein of unknown function (DUF1761)